MMRLAAVVQPQIAAVKESAMSDNSRHALVGAIGGTYISLATMDVDELTIANFALLNSANFSSPMEALERYLKSLPRVPDKVGLAVAGKVSGDTVTMTHLPWSFDRNDIRAATAATHICFVNEFEALALAAPRMTDYDLIEIGSGRPQPYGTRLVLSAGTGLGTAALVWSGEKWCAISGESRHASFPPLAADEFDIRSAMAQDGAVTAGQVFSGRGLVALYDRLLKVKGAEPAKLTPGQITQAGLSGEDQTASDALGLMATWLGRFTGDVALHYGATGGVYLAGGMPANMVPTLQSGRFRDAFEGTSERHAYLGTIPVHVIKAGADAGLRGAAVALANSLPVRTTSVRRLQA
jgi:glucokinase